MSVTYPQFPLSNFPDAIDTKQEKFDVTAEMKPYVTQYQAYLISGDFPSAIQYLVDHPDVIKYIANADFLNFLQDMALAMQTFFKNDVETYMANLQNALTSATFGQATTSNVGVAQLSSAIDSTDETMAATPKAVSSAITEAKYVTKADGTKYIWGIDDTGMYYKIDGNETLIYVAKKTVVDGKLNIPERITTGTSIEIIDNTEYELTDVTSLTFTYPVGNFECWIKLTTAASGTITITLPTSTYIGYAPTFSNGETWEISIKDSIVIAQKVGGGA